jgi:hypothetical protein
MRKSVFLGIVILAAVTKTCAQADTAKVEQYCEMLATGKLLSTKVTIDIDFGEARKFWSDNRIKDETGKVRNFNSVIDAMNYMGAQGWKLTTALLLGSGPYVYHYIFRREVLKSEFQNN